MKRFVVVLLLTACNKQAEKLPSCAEVTDHLLEVTRIAYPGHGDMGARGNRQAEIDACESRHLTAKERHCILAAKTTEAIELCRRERVKQESDAVPARPGAPPTGK